MAKLAKSLQPSALVEAFNAAHPIGTTVRYWPGVRAGAGEVSTTRSQAEVLSGHTAVVWVEARRDCIALTHVQALGYSAGERLLMHLAGEDGQAFDAAVQWIRDAVAGRRPERALVLSGAQGTGKTLFFRYLDRACPGVFIHATTEARGFASWLKTAIHDKGMYVVIETDTLVATDGRRLLSLRQSARPDADLIETAINEVISGIAWFRRFSDWLVPPT